MIEVEGQYQFKFKLGDKDDFIGEDDLESFTIIEEAGNLLPTFELVFMTMDPQAMSLFNEGNVLEISIGASGESAPLITTRLVILNVSLISDQDRNMLSINGLFNALSFLNDNNIFISDEKSGIEVIKEIAGKHFSTITSNVDTSQDKQNWIQHNIPDKTFINNIWMHCHIDNSFPIIGITTTGEFIVHDFKQALNANENKFKWKFTKVPKEDTNEIQYTSYSVQIKSGFNNQWIGYGREKPCYDVEKGTLITSKGTSDESILLPEGLLNRVNTIKERASRNEALNENVHENYWNAYLNNLSKLVMFSNVKLQLSYYNRFDHIKLFDFVFFSDTELSEEDTSSTHLSGLYVVSKISRNLTRKQFITVIELSREGLGGQKGDLR